MSDNISNNLSTLALWAAIIIGILSGFGTLISRSLNKRMDDQDKRIDEQKTELGRSESRVKESAKLAIDAVDKALNETKEAAKEKRAEDLERVKRLEQNYDDMNRLEPRKRP
jgi:hypothetical protein